MERRSPRKRAPDEALTPKRNTLTPWPLAGLCWCDGCGSAMVVSTAHRPDGKVYGYLRCSGRIKRGKSYCSAGDIPHAAVEAAIVEGLQVKSADGSIALACANWISDRRAKLLRRAKGLVKLRQDRDALAKRRDAVLDVVEQGGDAGRAAAGRLGDIQRQLDALEGELTGLEAAAAIQGRDERVVAHLGDAVQRTLATLPTVSGEHRGAILAKLVDRVRAQRDGESLRIFLDLAMPGVDLLFVQPSNKVLPTRFELVSPP
ncbi:MAG: recombinase zinc beta ribbon domain-containing protein [Planctomycetes bacterium]|nr:recombinase zinc beta ribbon domain-containing protein [Planctomycetota bacterium]